MRLFLPILIVAIITGCSTFKEVPVEYDYSYRGNFKKYRTFEIMRPLRADSSMINDQIEKSIIARMKFLGYKQSASRPHLIIGFKMFADSLKFSGYDQMEIEEWVKSQRTDINYEKQRYTLNEGTLLIQFFDRRQNRSIWQGYATTMYGQIDFQNSRHLRNAVVSILDKYRFWADGFLEGQNAPIAEDPN